MTCGLLLNLESSFLQKNPLLNLKKRAITRKIMALKKRKRIFLCHFDIAQSCYVRLFVLFVYTETEKTALGFGYYSSRQPSLLSAKSMFSVN